MIFGTGFCAELARKSEIARRFDRIASRSTRATVGLLLTAGASRGSVSKALEACMFLDERELRGPCRSVARLADDDLGNAFGTLIRCAIGITVLFFTIDEHDDVGVLLESARLAQVRQLRSMIGPRLRRARQLRERDDRYLEFLRQPFERP